MGRLWLTWADVLDTFRLNVCCTQVEKANRVVCSFVFPFVACLQCVPRCLDVDTCKHLCTHLIDASLSIYSHTQCTLGTNS